MIYTYWVIISLLILTYLSIQDVKNHCWIDSRLNHFMAGLTISLVFLMDRTLFYCFQISLAIFIMLFLLWDSKMFGWGDIEAFAWIYAGVGLIDMMHLAGFFIVSTLMGVIYIMAKKVFKKTEPSAFFPVILLAFMLTSLYFNYFA